MEATCPEEPLALSAPLARELAPRLCRVDPQYGSCAWYHGFWQYLRLLDFNTTPLDHAAFYQGALSGPIAAGDRSVLISGTADYALPACMLWIFGSAGAAPDLTVLDICATPPRLCEWYAARVGATIAPVVQDILTYDPASPYDIVATHSFLGRFSPEERRILFARWHRLLRPGGRVVTVNRVRPGAGERVRFTDEQAERFIARVREAAAGLKHPLDLSIDDLVAMARRYASGMRSYPLHSVDDLTGLFVGAGFRIEQLAVGPVGPRAAQAPTGPTMSGGADYARIVAVRA